MANPLNELTTVQLDNLRVRFKSIVLAQQAEITRRQIRLDNRMERQTVQNEALALLQDNLAKSIVVRDELIAAGASPEAIATAAELVASNQLSLDGYDPSPSFLSEEDAQIEQAEIDELELGRQDREAKIDAIETLLAAAS
ncbi:MAG: hypothetical protein AAGB22_05390 [Bacteroidota bacterium]